nr:hypothetical protein [Lactobacillus paragasseri]
MTLQINTRVDSITWPLNQNLTNQEIISQLELTVTENGQLISNDNLSINKKAVNRSEAGVYPVIITAIGSNNEYATKKIQAWVTTDKNNVSSTTRPPVQPTPAPQYKTPSQTPSSKKKSKKKSCLYCTWRSCITNYNYFWNFSLPST